MTRKTMLEKTTAIYQSWQEPQYW